MKSSVISVWVLLLLVSSLSRAEDKRVPVLLELFTSEGCSSCPSADALLTKLDREQPISDVDLVVMGEHVDYWNRGGWVDRYSSSAFTDRQQRYAEHLHIDDIYTPQLVVDGTSQLVGSDWTKAKVAIEAARHSRKLAISFDGAQERNGRTLRASIARDPELPKGDVYLVLAADAMDTQVRGGENSGRHLLHTSIAYSVAKIGKTSPDADFAKTITVPARPKWGTATRIIVFVQEPGTGHILGVAQTKS